MDFQSNLINIQLKSKLCYSQNICNQSWMLWLPLGRSTVQHSIEAPGSQRQLRAAVFLLMTLFPFLVLPAVTEHFSAPRPALYLLVYIKRYDFGAFAGGKDSIDHSANYGNRPLSKQRKHDKKTEKLAKWPGHRRYRRHRWRCKGSP